MTALAATVGRWPPWTPCRRSAWTSSSSAASCRPGSTASTSSTRRGPTSCRPGPGRDPRPGHRRGAHLRLHLGLPRHPRAARLPPGGAPPPPPVQGAQPVLRRGAPGLPRGQDPRRAHTVKTRLEGRHVRGDGLTADGCAFVADTLSDAGIAARRRRLARPGAAHPLPPHHPPPRRRRQPGHRRPGAHLAHGGGRADLAAVARGGRDQVGGRGVPDGPPALVALASAPPGSASTPPASRPSTPPSPTTAGRAPCAATSDQENTMKLTRITAAISAAALAAVLAGCGTTDGSTGRRPRPRPRPRRHRDGRRIRHRRARRQPGVARLR